MKINIIVFSIIISLLIIKETVGFDNIKNHNLFKQISLYLQNITNLFEITNDNDNNNDLTAS